MSEIKMFGSHLVNVELFPNQPFIIDAGACQGNFIDDISKWAKNPMILALEPNKKNSKGLDDKYDSSGVIVVEAALVGEDEPRTMKFVAFKGLPEWGNVSGLYNRSIEDTYDVETITLRETLGILPDVQVHLLKMDIEGCEHKVISDMTQAQAERIQQITLEVHGGHQEMENKLQQLGYDTKFENGELYAVRRDIA